MVMGAIISAPQLWKSRRRSSAGMMNFRRAGSWQPRKAAALRVFRAKTLAKKMDAPGQAKHPVTKEFRWLF
jgi:hypothetical protein